MRILFAVYDNQSYIPFFPLGIAALTAILEQHGHEVELFLQDVHHYPDEKLTQILDSEHFDLVGLSFIGGYWQYRKAIALANAINNSKNRPVFAIGGHGPSPEPEFFLNKLNADIVCIGEGEETILDLCNALNKQNKEEELLKVDGIAFKYKGEVAITKPRALIKDIDTLPFPAYHRFPMHIYRLLRMPNCTSTDFIMTMLSGRGCTFKCNFCYRMDKGFRPRSNESIIEEIKMLKKDYGITYIAFFDELLMSSVERTQSLCEDFIKHNLNIKWDCNGRLNYANKDLLALMRKSGCVFINYGIEAFDNKILKNMKKVLTTKQITTGIEATLHEGISPGLNIIFGNHGENRETLMKGVDFLLKYDDGAQLRTIRPVTPYPGSPLYYDAIKMGKIKNCEDFYENKHTNSDLLAANFTDLSDEEFYMALHEANDILLKNYQKRSEEKNKELLDNLYLKKDANFRGFRH